MRTLLKMDGRVDLLGNSGGGVPINMHGRDLTTADPRIPTAPERSTSGFRRPTPLAPSAKRREVFGESHKGELHPTKNRW